MTRSMPQISERAWHMVSHASGARWAANRLRYGPDAPRPGLRMTIPPAALTHRYHVRENGNFTIGHWRTGQVLAGDWDLAIRAFDRSLKYQSCKAHFLDGVAWEDTRAIPYGLKRIARDGKYDDCRTKADLLSRYARLDQLWEVTKAKGRLPFRAGKGTTPRTGILVHVDRNGTLLFGNKGFHRLAIAQLLDLPEITVILGVVHPGAIKSGAFVKRFGRAS